MTQTSDDPLTRATRWAVWWLRWVGWLAAFGVVITAIQLYAELAHDWPPRENPHGLSTPAYLCVRVLHLAVVQIMRAWFLALLDED